MGGAVRGGGRSEGGRVGEGGREGGGGGVGGSVPVGSEEAIDVSKVDTGHGEVVAGRAVLEVIVVALIVKPGPVVDRAAVDERAGRTLGEGGDVRVQEFTCLLRVGLRSI